MNSVPRRPLPLPLLAVLVAATATAACLRGETVEVFPSSCGCRGAFCVNSIVGKTSPSSDEEAGDCGACHFSEIGRCVEGCRATEVVMDVPGCAVAYACKSWDRIEPGASCTARSDCEPGIVAGEPVNTLDCVEGRCADLGSAKWKEVSLEPRSCDGNPFFGAHPQCAGAACLPAEQYGRDRFCSVARCLGDVDCPSGWFCRCQEETTYDSLLKGWRWCVPLEVPDAGSADAAFIAPPAGADAGQPEDDEPDAG